MWPQPLTFLILQTGCFPLPWGYTWGWWHTQGWRGRRVGSSSLRGLAAWKKGSGKECLESDHLTSYLSLHNTFCTENSHKFAQDSLDFTGFLRRCSNMCFVFWEVVWVVYTSRSKTWLQELLNALCIRIEARLFNESLIIYFCWPKRTFDAG